MLIDSLLCVFSTSSKQTTKVGQLKALKTQRGKLRDIRDLEERMLLDELEDTERKSVFRGPFGAVNHRIPLSKYPEIRNLQLEVSVL